MKKREIRNTLDALKTIKMAKIESQELRSALIRLHFTLLGEWKKFSDKLEDLRTVYLGAYQGEIEEVAPLEAEMMNPATTNERKLELASILGTHKDLQLAIKTFNEEAEKLSNEAVDVPLIPSEAFIAEAESQRLDLSIIEALYPVFSE